MRIGIVGGGAAGLISAWLLEADHDVTLFEKDSALGGHATSHAVTIDGVTHAVNPGFHFVSDKVHPTLLRLLDQIGVTTTPYRMTCTFYDADGSRAISLPPLGNMSRVATLAHRGTAATLLHLAGLLQRTGALNIEHDSGLTLEDFASSFNPDSFTQDFLYPFIASTWGVLDRDARRFSAPNALWYTYCNRGLSPRWLEVNGGMGEYTRTLAAACTRTKFHVGRAVRTVNLRDSGNEIIDDAGVLHTFDHVIVASNAESVRAILNGPGRESIRDAFAGLEYFDTKIAIHGDTSVMPRNRALWSVVNLRREKAATISHHWAGSQTNTPVFRSWVTHAARPVSPVYAEYAYRHPMPTPAYFAAQHAIAKVQGLQNLWFAGMHTTGYDNHESAVRSAIYVARRLNPDSANLRRLEPHPA